MGKCVGVIIWELSVYEMAKVFHVYYSCGSGQGVI